MSDEAKLKRQIRLAWKWGSCIALALVILSAPYATVPLWMPVVSGVLLSVVIIVLSEGEKP